MHCAKDSGHTGKKIDTYAYGYENNIQWSITQHYPMFLAVNSVPRVL